MRIQTNDGAQLLQKEITKLREQCAACIQTAYTLSNFSLEGMKGEAAQSLEEKIRLQASTAKAHQKLYLDIIYADQGNLIKLQALPTTSPGILDTDVAQQRLDEAQRACARFEEEKKEAERKNAERAKVSSLHPDLKPIQLPIPLSDYNAKINEQRSIIAQNETIIEKANEYARDISLLYTQVDTSVLNNAHNSIESYLAGMGPGNMNWTVLLGYRVNKSVQRLNDWSRRGYVKKFLAGELVISPAASGQSAKSAMNTTSSTSAPKISDSLQIEESVDGVGVWNITNDAKGILALKNHEGKYDKGKKTGISINPKAEYLFAQAKGEFSDGLLHGDYKVNAGQVSIGAKAEASILDEEGNLDPNITLEAKAGVRLLSGEGTLRYGDEYNNGYLKGKVDVGVAEASAKVGVSKNGVEAKAKAEAYVVEGKIDGGITVAGVKVNVEGRAKALGAGVSNDIKLGRDDFKLGVDAGLGAGLGGTVEVDWSGVPDAMDDTMDRIEQWPETLNNWWVDRR